MASASPTFPAPPAAPAGSLPALLLALADVVERLSARVERLEATVGLAAAEERREPSACSAAARPSPPSAAAPTRQLASRLWVVSSASQLRQQVEASLEAAAERRQLGEDERLLLLALRAWEQGCLAGSCAFHDLQRMLHPLLNAALAEALESHSPDQDDASLERDAQLYADALQAAYETPARLVREVDRALARVRPSDERLGAWWSLRDSVAWWAAHAPGAWPYLRAMVDLGVLRALLSPHPVLLLTAPCPP